MNILLDADGVLLDYCSALFRYLDEVEGIQPACPWVDETDYYLTNMYGGLPAGVLQRHIGALARDPERFASIPLMQGALAGVRQLRTLFPDARFVCITACGDDAVTSACRRRNLEPFKLDAVVTLPLGGNKRQALLEHPPGSIFIDDLLANIRVAESCGHVGILFDSPISRADVHPLRASSWDGVVAQASSYQRLMTPAFI